MNNEEPELPEVETVESEERKLNTRTKKLIAGAVGVVVIIALCAIFIPKLFSGNEKPDERLDEQPDAQQVKAMDIKPLDGDLVIESVGLSMSMEEMSVVDNVINPPGLESAYLVRDYGTPDDTSEMTVIALHSIKNGDVPGNKLIDVNKGEATVKNGDKIEVQGHDYTVETSYSQDKEAVSYDDGLWEDEPGKLLIFTCLQREEGKSVENIIIEAQSDKAPDQANDSEEA